MKTEDVGRSIQTVLAMGKKSLPFVYRFREEDRSAVERIMKGGGKGRSEL